MLKRITVFFLCVLLLTGMVLPVCANETEPAQETAVRELTISTREEFLTFAENCRLDTYSQALSVTLEKDIDLSGYVFEGIPIFSGSFDGRGHRITGLAITGDGSMLGLFRYLTADAVVQDLSLSGSVQPGGSKNEVGTIAGRNEGQILNCSFSGTVSGGDHTGGIAGTNGVTGIIENCRTEGEIHGNHFVGGIAGENSGVIRSCENHALINTTPQQNRVELSDITLDTLTNTEDVNTVTDIGGIAGISSGVIRSCENHSDVGYPHMGYNIGGIAGTQTGYIADCKNHGSIQGRKEVGGIVGQMEPASLIEYTQDTLQILQDQLGTMSGLVNKASSNAQTNANGISSRIGVLQDQAQTARDAVDTLLPDAGDLELPDADTILAAQNTLSTTINAMPGTLNSIASATQTTLYSLTRDLNAISGQISAMGRTLNNASENLGGTVTDISDEDTPELLTAKVEACINNGSILADLNAGGISGAMAVENDLDILEDWLQDGESSLNFQAEVRAVILNCRNNGTVTGSKQNIGGITGWQSLGLVKNCSNTGTVDGTNANYAGGISGLSTGYIRSSYAKCAIYGKTCAGGIAGSGTIVTDSLSQVKILEGKEKLGAILGLAEDSQTEVESPIAGNYYLCVDRDPGAIDGISYAGMAEPVQLDAFMSMENLPEIFRNVTVRFVFGDGKTAEFPVTPGKSFSKSKIPSIPEKEGFIGTWEGLDQSNLTELLFDMTFQAVYTAYTPVIQSTRTRDNGLPVLLVEGNFTSEAVVSVIASEDAPVPAKKETLLEAWDITMTEQGATARFQLPADTDAETLKLLIRNEDGTWTESPTTRDGSYLVFPLTASALQLALVEEGTGDLLRLFVGIGVAFILPAIYYFLKRVCKEKSKKD